MKTFQIVFFLIMAYMSSSFGKHFLIKTADAENGDYIDGLDIETADPDDKKSNHFLQNLKEKDESNEAMDSASDYQLWCHGCYKPIIFGSLNARASENTRN